MKSPKIPKPPDPNVVAAAQTGSNQSTAMYQQLLNMQDQATPYGSSEWSTAGTWSYKDPATGKTVTVPKFTNTTKLSPEQQALLKQEQQFDARWNDLALQQTGRVKDTLSTPFKYNIGEHEKWAGKTYDDLNKDSIASSREALEQNLSNRGIQYGTKAYDDAMRDWEYGTQKARSDFMLGAYNTGMSTALTERNQPLMEGQALMGAGQIQQPQWVSGPQAGVAGTDIAGIQNAAYQGSVARAQAQNAASGAMFNSLGTLGGMALGGWLSDERAKEVGPPVGTDPESGLPVREWRYTPTAQDVAQVYPEAVSQGEDGMLRVDWRKVPGGEKFMPRQRDDGDGFVGGMNMRPEESASPARGEMNAVWRGPASALPDNIRGMLGGQRPGTPPATSGMPRPFVGDQMNRDLPDAEFWPRGEGNGNWQQAPSNTPFRNWPENMPRPRKELQASRGMGMLQRLGA